MHLRSSAGHSPTSKKSDLGTTKFGFPFPRSFLLPSFRSARFALIINERERERPPFGGEVGSPFYDPRSLRRRPPFGRILKVRCATTIYMGMLPTCRRIGSKYPPYLLYISMEASSWNKYLFETPRSERRHSTYGTDSSSLAICPADIPDDRGIKIQTRFCPSIGH